MRQRRGSKSGAANLFLVKLLHDSLSVLTRVKYHFHDHDGISLHHSAASHLAVRRHGSLDISDGCTRGEVLSDNGKWSCFSTDGDAS